MYYSFISIYHYHYHYFSSHKRPTKFYNLWKCFWPTTQPNSIRGWVDLTHGQLCCQQ